MASPTEENYLKALFNLKDENGKVSISELSSMLKVSMPTANSMVKNLLKKGFINYEKYKPIELTKEGNKMAALVIRKHRLTEMYLVEKMKFGWEEVHDVAEQIEHINSPIFFQRMDELLGHPEVDPHGSPIPNAQGIIANLNYKPLSGHHAGDVVRLAALAHSSAEFLDFLNSRSLKLGTEISVISLESFDGSMVVSYQGRSSEGFSSMVCKRLLVEDIK